MATAKYFATFASPTVLYSGGFLLVTADSYVTELTPRITYATTSSFSGMAAAGGTVELVDSLGSTVDTVGWGTKTTTINETELAIAPPDGSSIQRIVSNGISMDTNNNKNDFEILSIPTPEVANTEPNPPLENPDPDPVPLPTPETPPTDTGQADTDIPPSSEQIPPAPADPPPVAETELPILLNELFIDPATPLTDASDEWVELYNPNDISQDLGGYTVYAGETFAYHHTFRAGVSIEPHGYLTLTSAETSIALANGGGAVKITGPAGQIFDNTHYETAKTNQAWAKDTNGQWQWTTTPTQNLQNTITAPTVAEDVVATAAANSKKSAKTTSASNKASSTPKATTTKTTAVKAAKAKVATDTTDTALLVSAPSPLPIWLLATLGCLAVLYSAYEYRFDIANKIYQFRRNREARQSNR